MVIEGSELLRFMGTSEIADEHKSAAQGKDPMICIKASRDVGKGFDIMDNQLTFNQRVTVRNFEEPRRLGLKFQMSGITQGMVDTMGKNFTSITGDNNLVVSDDSNSELIFSKQQDYRCILINFAPDFVISNLSDLESRMADRIIAMLEGIRTDFLLRSFDRFDHAAIQILQELMSCPFKDGIKELYFEIKVMQLLNHQLGRLDGRKEPASVKGTASELRKIKDLGQYLKENLTLQHSAADLAVLSEMNSHRLKTLFKSVYQMSVFEYQQSLRLSQARELLARGDTTISEISHTLGYSQPSHFIHAFKKKFECTPANFRSHDQSIDTP